MKKLLLLFSLIFAVSCTGNKFEQIEYFKSPDKFRVFVYVAPTATIDEIKAHASSQMWTERKITEVLYFRSDPFGARTFGSVTMAKSFQEAYQKAVVPGCIFRCQIDNFGNKYFSETPYEDRLKAIEESNK
ncbi:MAG TPA: hypothetical protein H9995_04150 [Candidatus Alistipes excrementigallinarum]|nr:hypothetical protein [Candidatus Alistipes excrementigallinarum]